MSKAQLTNIQSVPHTHSPPDVEASASTGVESSGIAEGNKVLQLCAGKREVHQRINRCDGVDVEQSLPR